MDDLIIDFITETNESIEELDADLVNLEKNPNDKDLLGKIFRLMHTIKGTCGFLSLPRLEKVAHHAENVLGRFRDGDLEVTAGYVTLIFESIDQIKFIVAEIEETGGEPEGGDAALIAKLDAAYEGKDVSGDASAVGESTSLGDVSGEKDIVVNIQEKSLAPGEASIDELEAAFAAAPGMDGIVNSADSKEKDIVVNIQEKSLAPGEASMDELEAAFAAAPGMDGIVNPADLNKKDPVNPKKKKEVKKPKSKKEKTDKPKAKKAPAKTLRVAVDVLEDLMTMVSELVLTRNQLLQIVRTQGDTEFSTPLQRLSHVVSELQEGVMATRMQPIGNAWSKLPRIIRDLSIELDKKIELVMTGQETELDRQVLELIQDPLTHMVRNSGDHGIETPADRVEAGKSETGTISLDAFHEGGHIIIRISDDGKGLPEDKIRSKILENGLATEEEIGEMSSQQIQQFIFHAGLSTAEKVTAVSGRGVGMDVVRTNIEKIGGSIDLRSTEGKGSTFTIKIPLTLAIVSALIVEAENERFAIPQLSVRELVMISDHGDNRIEYIKGSPLFRLRDRLLPLVSLGSILGLSDKNAFDQVSKLTKENDESESETESETEGNAFDHKNLYLVIAQVGGYDFGIIVDRVFDTEEIVVKPVAQMLKDLTLFSGNTILGDGSVIMILDPNGIANATGNIAAVDDPESKKNSDGIKADSEKKTSLLLFKVGGDTPKAVPLSLVSRLENIKSEDVEYSSGQMTVQYRGTLMPLTPFDPSVKISEGEEKPVLVFSDNGNAMGIVVDEIIDIMEEVIDIKLHATQSGLLGSAIIDGQATDVVDIAHFLKGANKDWFEDGSDTPFISDGDEDEDICPKKLKKRVLFVDDSPFFRNMITPLLSMAGYEVTTLEKPQDAIKMCEDGVEFDVIISDIEMPDMDGFEFAAHIKSEDSKWMDTPLVALSSHATPKDIERGLNVGFNNYVAKFDRDTLLDTLVKTLADAE